MKTLLIFTLLSWIVFSPALQAQPSSTATKITPSRTEEEIRAFLTELKAIRADKKALARFADRTLADPFISTDESGSRIQTKAQMLTNIQTMSDAVNETWDLDSLRVVDYGNTAVAIYLRTSVSDFNGQKLTRKDRETDMFVKRNGRWQHVAGHSSGIAADRPVGKVDPKLFDAYTGQYEAAPNLVLTVTREGDKLMGQWPSTSMPKVELLPQNETTFFTKVLPGSIVFVKGETNQASHFIYRQANGEELKGKKVP
ncbi:DUF3471 domain-containing protein [Spirosoma areae]